MPRAVLAEVRELTEQIFQAQEGPNPLVQRRFVGDGCAGFAQGATQDTGAAARTSRTMVVPPGPVQVAEVQPLHGFGQRFGAAVVVDTVVGTCATFG